jgi:hypothetical protein
VEHICRLHPKVEGGFQSYPVSLVGAGRQLCSLSGFYEGEQPLDLIAKVIEEDTGKLQKMWLRRVCNFQVRIGQICSFGIYREVHDIPFVVQTTKKRAIYPPDLPSFCLTVLGMTLPQLDPIEWISFQRFRRALAGKVGGGVFCVKADPRGGTLQQAEPEDQYSGQTCMTYLKKPELRKIRMHGIPSQVC